MQNKSPFNFCLWQLSIRNYKDFSLASQRQGWGDSFKPLGAAKQDQEHSKEEIAHGATHIGTHQVDESLSVPAGSPRMYSSSAPSPHREFAEGVLAATGGWETPGQLLLKGEDQGLSDTPPFLQFCFSEFVMSAFLGYLISISHELAQIFFQEVTM